MSFMHYPEIISINYIVVTLFEEIIIMSLAKRSSLKNKLVQGYRLSKDAFIGAFLTITLFLFLLPFLTPTPTSIIQALAQPASVANNNNSSIASTTAAAASSKTQSNQTGSINDQLTLGNPFLEEKGKVILQRVTGITNGLPRIETSFSANDTINGNIPAREIGSYVTVPRPASGNTNVLFGEGQGAITTKDGEMATWTGQGIGHFTSDGKIVFRGSLFFTTTSTGKLAFLNNMVGIFQYQVDTSGNTYAKVWGWK
jgi:hypothetical protein